jgi:hypothetical protein
MPTASIIRTMTVEAESSPETSAGFYQTTQRNILEDMHPAARSFSLYPNTAVDLWQRLSFN